MKSIRVRVPLRVDLAGGTLDLWPLYLFHPGSRTVNVAISMFAECEVTSSSSPGISIFFTDDNLERHYEDHAALSADPEVALVARAVEHLKVTGVRIVTRTEAPRGSGLGGSSALAIALVRALTEFIDQPVEGEALIELVRDLETRLLGIPAGVQDYYPPVFGGLASLQLEPGRLRRTGLSVPLNELAQHLVVYYSGISHFSGTNNWEIYKRHIDKDEDVVSGLDQISGISVRMERALDTRDYASAGAAIADEWKVRRNLIKGISNDEIDGAISDGLDAGAWGGKVCGAGGGGCLVFLCPPDRREAVVSALSARPGSVLPISPVSGGLTIETEDQRSDTAPAAPRRGRAASAWYEPLEQYVLRGEAAAGALRPWLLAEVAIRWDEPRMGLLVTRTRTVVAPIDTAAADVEWGSSLDLNEDQLELENAPPGKAGDLPDLGARAIEPLLENLLERERLMVLYNPSLELYSEAGESRQHFLERCREVATSTVENQSDRLESTFRRRIDQMRERSERDQREREAFNEQEESPIQTPDVAISWGQALYKITKGRPAASESPQSVDEADYAQKITQLQRQWERELEVLREEQEARARSIEELSLSPGRRNLDIMRVAILWASRIPRSALASGE